MSATIPDGIVIIEDFLSAETISKLRGFADGQIGMMAKVEVAASDGRLGIRKHEGFSADRINVQPIEEVALAVCDELFGKVVPENYAAEIECYEYPHILRYRRGGNYKPHADADSWDEQAVDWVRSVDRDYSGIIYFNDEFEGGTLFFPGHDFRIAPKSGMLVCFPSGGLYEHTAEPVTSGNRYALVTWAVAVGTPRVFDSYRGEVVQMKDRRV